MIDAISKVDEYLKSKGFEPEHMIMDNNTSIKHK